MKESTPLSFKLSGDNPELVRKQILFIKQGWMAGQQTNQRPNPGGGGGQGGGGGGGGGGSSFGSITFNAPLTTTLVPTTAAGGGSMAFGRNSTAYVIDWEGRLVLVKNAEARFLGARRVQNLLAKSEALDDVAWTKVTMTVGTGIADPLGGTTAFTLTATGAGAECYQSFAGLSTLQTRCSSMWVRRRTGTGTVTLYFDGTGTAITTAVTSSWQRVSVGGAAAATSFYDIRLATSGDAIDVWHPQHEDTTGQSNTNPSEYVSSGVLSTPWHGANTDSVKYFATKNGNTVASFVVTEATGIAINTANGGSARSCDASGPLGLMVEGNISNIQGNSEAINAWNLVNSTVTANNALAPNGTLTADTLNENAVASVSHGAYYASGGKGASAIPLVGSIFIKKIARDWVYFSIYDDLGSYGDCYFNLATGATGTTHAVNFSNIVPRMEQYANGWWRLYIYCTSTTRNLTGLQFFSAVADNDSTPVTPINGPTYVAWGAQINVASFPSTYIPAGVSPPYEGITWSTFAGNASATEGTLYVETKTQWATAANVYPLISFGTATLYPLYSNTSVSTTISTSDGTNTVSRTGVNAMDAAVVKLACSWIGTKLAIAGTGANATSGTFDGNMGSTAIGVGNPTTGTGVVWNGYIRNITIWSGAANNGQLNALV